MPAPRNGYMFDPADPGASAKAIASDHHDIELAIARNFPRFRQPVADKILQRVCRENALFALVTALPNVLPSVIDLPWAIGEFATDTAFLTMNQIRMALLLAAAYDRRWDIWSRNWRSARLRREPSAGAPSPANWWAKFRWAAG